MDAFGGSNYGWCKIIGERFLPNCSIDALPRIFHTPPFALNCDGWLEGWAIHKFLIIIDICEKGQYISILQLMKEEKNVKNCLKIAFVKMWVGCRAA